MKRSGGWIIKRNIFNTDLSDAIGPYPLFTCRNWDTLSEDLSGLSNELVSVSLVTDPLQIEDINIQGSTFFDKLIPFKKHFVIELNSKWEDNISRHHRRNVRKAYKTVIVRNEEDPISKFGHWIELYQHLIKKHNIKGIAAFTHSDFERQFKTDGLKMFCAEIDGKISGIVLFIEQTPNCYYHLAAYNELGYGNRTSFALFDHAIRYFKNKGIKRINLGSGAGTTVNNNDGLNRFKSGWTNYQATAWFCGKILDKENYEQLNRMRSIKSNGYFPSYRIGEFQ